jgi:two-component system, LytTR family, response regulator
MSNIAIHTAKGATALLPQNIVRIQGLSNYSRIYFADNSWPLTVAKGLKQLQASLPEALFMRPHRTHLVNKNFVVQIRIRGKCSYLLLQNGETIAISRRKRTVMKQSTESGLIKN